MTHIESFKSCFDLRHPLKKSSALRQIFERREEEQNTEDHLIEKLSFIHS